MFSFSFVVFIFFFHGYAFDMRKMCDHFGQISRHIRMKFLFGNMEWIRGQALKKHTTIIIKKKHKLKKKKERSPSAFHFVNRIISTEISMWKQHNNWGHWNFVRTDRQRDIQNIWAIGQFKWFFFLVRKFLFRRK